MSAGNADGIPVRNPVDIATPEELTAFVRGKEEIARGNYVSLQELREPLS